MKRRVLAIIDRANADGRHGEFFDQNERAEIRRLAKRGVVTITDRGKWHGFAYLKAIRSDSTTTGCSNEATGKESSDQAELGD